MHHRQEENINYLFYLYTSVCLYVLSHDANGFPIVGHSKKKKAMVYLCFPSICLKLW
jgi:hypothetical protein